jgi:hypothetical protein
MKSTLPYKYIWLVSMVADIQGFVLCYLARLDCKPPKMAAVFVSNIHDLEDAASSIHGDNASIEMHVTPRSDASKTFGLFSTPPPQLNKIGRESLPEQVARLAAANSTLMASLRQAHVDLENMLTERDELSDALQGAEQDMQETGELATSWMLADRDWMQQRTAHLKQQMADIQSVRATMYEKLKVLDGPRT